MRYALDEALKSTPSPGNLAAAIARFGDVELEFYQPRTTDPQTPHERDELYIIARGRGEFEQAAARHAFEPGDAIFVPAKEQHRFLNFTQDFAVWVIFF